MVHRGRNVLLGHTGLCQRRAVAMAKGIEHGFLLLKVHTCQEIRSLAALPLGVRLRFADPLGTGVT